MGDLYRTIQENCRRLLAECGTEPAADAANSRRWAQAVRRGSIFFYETQEVAIGHRDIDWTGSHLQHQEWPAQLNRFFCLPHLAAAYADGGDDDLPGLARAMIEDWIGQHDYDASRPPAPGDNTLNTSLRLGQSRGCGWWPAVAAFDCPEVFDEAFLDRMRDSSRGQLACLRAHLAPKGNWRISHLDTLLFCGLVVPGLDEHVSFAVDMLNECLHRQINNDGAHEEHCPSYHSWMCEVATSFWQLAQARPELGLDIEAERVGRMWDYRVCSTAPDGGSLALNDSGGWTPAGRGTAGLRQRRQEFLDRAGLEGNVWNLDVRPSRYFPDAGQLFLRTNWEPDGACTVFDLSRWHGWHSHLGRNSVNVFAGGRYLLPDPGVFSYEGSDPFAAYGRSTAAHNTVTFSLMNQSEANTDVHTVHVFEDLAVVASDYQGGYFGGEFNGSWCAGHRPGIFGTHERILLWLGDLGSLVWDFCNVDLPGQTVSTHWNLGSADAAAADGRGWTQDDDANILVQAVDSNMPLQTRIFRGQNPPALGWRPLDAKGGREPAPLLCFEGQATGRHVRSLTLLHPFAGSTAPTVIAEPWSCRYGRASGCTLTWPDGTEVVAAATPRLSNQVGEAGPLDSDGALAAVVRRNDETRAVVIGGRFLRLRGDELVRARRAGAHVVR
jgi:hypothetical protein